MRRFLAFAIAVITFLLSYYVSFSQEEKKFEDFPGADIYLGYSYDNLNKSAKFLSIGVDFFENKDSFLKPLFNFECQVGFSDGRDIYTLNFSPGIRCNFGKIQNFNFYYEAIAGFSAIKHPLYTNMELGFNSKLGLGFGYRNFLIYIDLKYLQSKDIIINPVTIGFKFYIPH